MDSLHCRPAPGWLWEALRVRRAFRQASTPVGSWISSCSPDSPCEQLLRFQPYLKLPSVVLRLGVPSTKEAAVVAAQI